LQDIFYETVGENDWTWKAVTLDEYGKRVSIVQKKLVGVNMFKSEDLYRNRAFSVSFSGR
jgi:hypothetical protein